MKQVIKYSELNEANKARVDRFLLLSHENGIRVAISTDQTSVILVNPSNGDIEASMPITDFIE